MSDARQIIHYVLEGEDDWIRLYHTSPTFKIALDQTVDLLLLATVPGLAIRAEADDALQERIRAEIENPSPGITIHRFPS